MKSMMANTALMARSAGYVPTLLRLLDAARADLAEVREAAKWFVRDLPEARPELKDFQFMIGRIEVGKIRRLAAALAKDAPT